MHCCLWFRSVFRVRGPWPKRYGYHLSIINIIISSTWEGRSHALLFMVPLGLPSARPMAQALRLPFEYYYYYYYYYYYHH